MSDNEGEKQEDKKDEKIGGHDYIDLNLIRNSGTKKLILTLVEMDDADDIGADDKFYQKRSAAISILHSVSY